MPASKQGLMLLAIDIEAARKALDACEAAWFEETKACEHFEGDDDTIGCTHPLVDDPVCDPDNCQLLFKHPILTGNKPTTPWDKSCPYCTSKGCDHPDWLHSSAYEDNVTLCYQKDCPLTK